MRNDQEVSGHGWRLLGAPENLHKTILPRGRPASPVRCTEWLGVSAKQFRPFSDRRMTHAVTLLLEAVGEAYSLAGNHPRHRAEAEVADSQHPLAQLYQAR